MAGYLSNGVWHSADPHRTDRHGAFVRTQSQFRDWVTSDGVSGFKAEPGRYHLYVSLACPWAHRTLLYRVLKGLEQVISVSVVDPVSGPEGWVFSDYPGATVDHANGFQAIHQLYVQSQKDYTGLVTVPVFWDKVSQRIVNNESSEIIRMLDSAFEAYASNPASFYPGALQGEIDVVNDFVYGHVNNGVYRCGFASTQSSYESAVAALFHALDVLEERLSRSRFLIGNELTEADLRLFPTLVRFDAVYFIHFKCSVRRIADYPNLSGYLRDIFQLEGVDGTVNMEHIKRHYYLSHPQLNPKQIIPVGPDFDLSAPHDRARLS